VRPARGAHADHDLTMQLEPDEQCQYHCVTGPSSCPWAHACAGCAGTWLAAQRNASARLALLGCMLTAALAMHSAVIYGPKGGVEDLRWGLSQVCFLKFIDGGSALSFLRVV
jgi:hypothetical protein